MGSIERKQRVRENTRRSILKAAIKIVKEEGWQALSMRKIADIIEYSAPVIYEHFTSKDALLSELTKTGFQRLGDVVNKARAMEADVDKQLEMMWLAYWEFAFAEKEYYQLMFGVDTPCSLHKMEYGDSYNPSKIFMDTIEMGMPVGSTQEQIAARYFTLWSVVHGLIAINLVKQGTTNEINNKVLLDSLRMIR